MNVAPCPPRKRTGHSRAAGCVSAWTGSRMRADLYEKVFEIVSSAAELPGDARAEYVADRCGGDAELLHEVEQALSYSRQAEAEAFLDGSPVIIAHAPGVALIDGYENHEFLGEGGQGEVYRARRSGALRKEVAIKIIHSDRQTEEVLRRFNKELRIYEKLREHPNIARLDSAGRTRDGRPF